MQVEPRCLPPFPSCLSSLLARMYAGKNERLYRYFVESS